MSQDEYITKAGKIKTRKTKRGTQFYAWNHERQRLIHVGTLQGATYEKGNVSILRKPEPSICLPQSEFGAAVDAGAQFLRCIPFDKSQTFAISLKDFKAFASPYYNSAYGPQLRVQLSKFSRIAAVARRNLITDNPITPAPEYKQLELT